jgi:hypothetical protein
VSCGAAGRSQLNTLNPAENRTPLGEDVRIAATGPLSVICMMPAESRAAFRATPGVDDATWTRGRGWALATALYATFYAAVNPGSPRRPSGRSPRR